MELGSPPLYAALNKACRDKDTTQIRTLGPLAWVLSFITNGDAEDNRGDKGDNIKTGEDIEDYEGGLEYNIGGIFMLWRGAKISQD